MGREEIIAWNYEINGDYQKEILSYTIEALNYLKIGNINIISQIAWKVRESVA